MVEHFRVQLNPLFIQQIILFLNQKKINFYDEMTIIEFIQGIFDSGSFIGEDPDNKVVVDSIKHKCIEIEQIAQEVVIKNNILEYETIMVKYQKYLNDLSS